MLGHRKPPTTEQLEQAQIVPDIQGKDIVQSYNGSLKDIVHFIPVPEVESQKQDTGTCQEGPNVGYNGL